MTASFKVFAACVVVIGLLCCNVAHAADYLFSPRTTAPGNDVECGQRGPDGKPQKFCKLCEGIPAIAAACDANPLCKGFDMEGGYCGYLKGAAGRGKTAYTEGFSHYCKQGAGIICEGQYIAQLRADLGPQLDIDCNFKNYKGEKQSYCEVSGSQNDVAAACSLNPKCKAFTTTQSSNGFLKSGTGPLTYTEGVVTYRKV